MKREIYFRDVLYGMKKNFDFSKYYFFYSHHSIAVKNGDYENKIMDADLDTIKDFNPGDSSIYFMSTKNIDPEGMGGSHVGFAIMDE
ncbi:MAG: hypothetical protein ABEH43_06695, partial [Flavobacteriales bacterium]